MSKSAGTVQAESIAWRDYGTPTVPPLLQSALGSFVAFGYHAATMRVVARAAGLSVPGLYHHYASKQIILVDVMSRAMDDLYSRSLAALEEAGGSIENQFKLQVECLVLFHALRADLAFVAATEIRSLEPDARARHIAARDRQQQILDDVVQRGVDSGVFRCEFPHDASRAIVTMCTGVAQWYRPGGDMSPEELADRYVLLGLRALKFDS